MSQLWANQKQFEITTDLVAGRFAEMQTAVQDLQGYYLLC